MSQSPKKSAPEHTPNHHPSATHQQTHADTEAKPSPGPQGPKIKDRRFWASKEDKTPADAPEVLDAEATQPDPATALKSRIAELEDKLSATLGQYKEALESFEAAKLRLKREVAQEINKGRKDLLVPLLDVLDNLDRALESEANKAQQGALFEGVTMVQGQFLQRLEAQGIARVEALGQAFDPKHFEAISTVPVDSKDKDGLVVGIVRQAYVMAGETVRHGMVAVGKFGG